MIDKHNGLLYQFANKSKYNIGTYMDAVVSVLDNTVDDIQSRGEQGISVRGRYTITIPEIRAIEAALTVFFSDLADGADFEMCARDILEYHASCMTSWADSPSVSSWFKDNFNGVVFDD